MEKKKVINSHVFMQLWSSDFQFVLWFFQPAACRCFHWRLRVFLCSVSRTAGPDRAGSHSAVGGNQSGVLGRVCKVRLDSNAKNSSPPATWFLIPFLSLLRSSPAAVPGAGVRDFFCRVAALTFEANILSDLEKIGSRNVNDIISESLCLTLLLPIKILSYIFMLGSKCFGWILVSSLNKSD